MFINLAAFDYLDSNHMLNYSDSFKVSPLDNQQVINCQDMVINFDLDILKDYFTYFRHNLDILVNQVVNFKVDLVDSQVVSQVDSQVVNQVGNSVVDLVDSQVVNSVGNWGLGLVDNLEVDTVGILTMDLVNILVVDLEVREAYNLAEDSFIIDSMDILLVVMYRVVMDMLDNLEVVDMALINCMVIGNKEHLEVSLVSHYFIDNIKDLKGFKVVVNILNQKTIQMRRISIQPIFPELLMIIKITL